MFKKIFLVLIFATTHLVGSLPLGHCYFAQLWMEQHESFSKTEEEAFMRGTLFPDIRYIVEISREDTHIDGVTLDDVAQCGSPFFKGILLHCWVDHQRSQFVKATGIKAALEGVPREGLSSFLKLIEDELIWNAVDHELIQRSLASVGEEELETGVSTEEIVLWHQMISRYCAVKPSQLLLGLAVTNKGVFAISPETVALWNEIFNEYCSEDLFRQHVTNLLALIEECFENGSK